MLRQIHLRRVLAAILMVLVLAPLAAAFAGPSADPHACCREDASVRMTPTQQEDCCYVSARPSPAPAAVAPVNRTVSDVALVSVTGAAVEVDPPAEFVTMSETASSPPNPSICSSVLRI